MTSRKNETGGSAHTCVRAALWGLLAGAALTQTAWGETGFTPRLAVIGTWIDNFHQAGPGQPKEEEFLAQVIPGVNLTRDGARLDLLLDYEAQALFVPGQDGADEIFHQGQFGAHLEAVPQWFYVDASAVRLQTVVDPTQPVNLDNLFGTRNFADTTTLTVTPALRHEFRHARFDASYTVGVVDFDSDDQAITPILDDSENSTANVYLGNNYTDDLITWALRYRNERVEYDVGDRFESDRADAELGIRLGHGWRFLMRGGLETDPLTHATEGGLDETLWQAGFSWARDEDNQLRLMVGERFFGTSYDAMWRRTGRRLNFELGYIEEPTTQAHRFALRAPIEVGEPLPPLEPGREFSRITADVYLLRQARAHLSLKGRITEVALDLTGERREYVLLQGIEDETRGAALMISRQLGPRLTVMVRGGYSDIDLREGLTYRDYLYTLQFLRRIGLRTTMTISANHIDRSGSVQTYSANWAMLGVEMTF